MKKQLLYLSSIADDAPQTAKDYGLGLELAQFCTAAFLDNPDKVTELFPQDCARYLESSLAACLSSSDRFVLHGPFNELCPAAIDPLVLEITEKRYRQAIDRAVSLGCPKLVLHAGFVPLVYHPEWFVSRSVLVWKRLMREVPETLTVCLENVMEPDETMLLEILRQVDSPQLKPRSGACKHHGKQKAACAVAACLCAVSLSRTFTQQRRCARSARAARSGRDGHRGAAHRAFRALPARYRHTRTRHMPAVGRMACRAEPSGGITHHGIGTDAFVRNLANHSP